MPGLLGWVWPRKAAQSTQLPVVIRRVRREDLDAVFELWCSLGDEEIPQPPLSFDRWGPGIAVPAAGAMPTSHIPLEPSMCVRQHLAATVSHPASACFVAEHEGALVGFVTCSWSDHPTMGGHTGQIEELYVRPAVRRRAVGTQLLRAALAYLRDYEATVFKVEVPFGDARAIRFFQRSDWVRESTALTLHD
ncbi:MAG TPA: GNAT family N-acetyltransferase [Pseudonocardiaceae bacterium]|jgi:GNAT superfamily N-acetyltransferase|nr:GNAT family N-acetyltransferase [Pseudonocardiaceae bacterium]